MLCSVSNDETYLHALVFPRFKMNDIKTTALFSYTIAAGFPLAQHIFDKIALADNVQYLVRASYLEIYNEEIRDLLSKVLGWVQG